MAAYETYETYDEPRRHKSSRHRDREEPRYVETQQTYTRAPAPAAPDPPYGVRQTDIIRRPTREDSDLSVEEIRRDFPPPGVAGYAQRTRDDRHGPPLRSRSAERAYGAHLGDSRRSDLDHRSRKTYVEEKVEPRRRSLSRNQKILAAVGGAALAVGGKELWDRREADGRPMSRNALATAAVGAAGAFGGYEAAELYAKHGDKAQEKVKTYIAAKNSKGDVAEEVYSDTDSDAPKRPKSRRKSLVEGALGALGAGAAAKAISGGGKRHSRRGSGDSYYSRRSGRSRGRDRSPEEGAKKIQQAAKAALIAGATEAFRVRNEPGGWGGAKGKRILTAAIGAGGIDAAADRDPDRKSKRHILEAVVGGLAGNRLINGSRKEVDDDYRSTRGGRSRSRSRSRGGGSGGPLAALATAGLAGLAAKKIGDRSRSRSRSRGARRRSYSSDSYDSRSPSPRRGERPDRHRRSKSISDTVRKGLAAVGIGEAAHEAGRDRDREVVEEEHVYRSRRRGDDDGYEPRRNSDRDAGFVQTRGDPYGDPRYADSRSSLGSRRNGGGGGGGGGGGEGGRRGEGGGGRRSARQADGQRNKRIAEGKGSESGSDSSLGSSSGDEKRIKKMKGKQILAAGLASVATIHAAHNIYQSMEKRDARHKAVQEGEMTPEEARKLKAKATLQDAASVGIAALGIKGAISEIKEANEMRHECREFREKKEERHKKRLERQKKSQHGGGGKSRAEGSSTASNGPRNDYGPRYNDGNPYATGLPAPPVGYSGR